ncbi:MAG TPA: DUF3159 domain-containing protein [Pseudolysinimonas sp.]|nr:DUF3159 domain-containing protein [Pseudolysinimonas sp.]
MVEESREEPTDSSDSAGSAGLRDAFSQAAQRSRLSGVTPGETPSGSALLAAVGGIRGLVETIVPGLAFLVIYTTTKNLPLSVIAPFGLALVFIVVRAVQRQPVMPAVSGAIGIALSAGLALLTNNASNNFVPGFIINAVALLVMLISLTVRRPLIGALVGLLTGDSHWRQDRAKFRVAVVATVLWAILSGLRLAVQLPLYFAHAPDALAATKLLMGVPLYAGLLWVTWLLVRTAWRSADDEAPDSSEPA